MLLSKALYHTCFICGQRCKWWSRRPKLTLSVISDVKPIIYIYIQHLHDGTYYTGSWISVNPGNPGNLLSMKKTCYKAKQDVQRSFLQEKDFLFEISPNPNPDPFFRRKAFSLKSTQTVPISLECIALESSWRWMSPIASSQKLFMCPVQDCSFLGIKGSTLLPKCVHLSASY